MVDTLTDAQVAAAYDLAALLKELGENMATMVGKLPERHSRLRAKAELARQIIEALK